MAGRLPVQTIRKMMGSPDLIARGMRQAIRKHLTSKRDFHRPGGRSANPIQLDLKLVEVCNLRCKMCPQWGESGYNLERSSEQLQDILPLETYFQLVDDLADVKPWVYLWGGEPFLYSGILRLIEYMKAKRFPVSVVTNGTRLDRHVERLVAAGTDVLMFSIDGPKDTHDNIRGYRGAFEAAKKAILAIQKEKRRRKTAKPHIILNSVFTKDNQSTLDQVCELGEEVAADLVFTCFGWYQTPASGARQQAFLEEKLGLDAWSWRSWLTGAKEIDPAVVAETVRRIQSRRWSFAHTTFPNLRPDQIHAYYTQHEETFGHDSCLSPWLAAQIMPNGDVVTCRDYPDVVVGNIRSSRILDIWNNDASRRFRGLLQNDGLMPICTRCQGLMCL